MGLTCKGKYANGSGWVIRFKLFGVDSRISPNDPNFHLFFSCRVDLKNNTVENPKAVASFLLILKTKHLSFSFLHLGNCISCLVFVHS